MTKNDSTAKARAAFEAGFATAEEKRAHFAELGRKSGIAKRRNKARKLSEQADQDKLDQQASCPHRFPRGPADWATCTYCDLPYVTFAERLQQAGPV